jgi:hypothetical protein
MEITLKPTLKQHIAYQSLERYDEIFFGGGAGGGKSWFICESRLINALRYPGYRSFIGREELKRLMQSTYVTWCKVCQYHKIPQAQWSLNGQYNYIQFKNGSRIDLLDLKFLPSDPMYERFGSLEYTDGAIEEAGEVHALAKEVLKSRIGRHMNKELGLRATLLCSGNPKKNWTYISYYKPWKQGTLPKNICFIQSLYKDNPYTSSEYGRQLLQIKDRPTRERLRDGNWEYDIDENNLMRYDCITDLFSNIVVPDENKFLIIDVARFGSDRTIFHFWNGYDLYKRLVFEKKGINELQTLVRDLSHQENVPFSHILIDEDGVGGGLVDNLFGVKGFRANSRPFEGKDNKPENFQNVKAQCAYKLADKVNDHELAITIELSTTDREMIIEELEQIKSKDADKDGKRKIIPKEEVKEVLGRSPDDGDCLIMRMWFEFKVNLEEGIKVFIPD